MHERVAPPRKEDMAVDQEARHCWSCRTPIDDLFFCKSCHVLQRPHERMDYFCCFGLDCHLNVDLKLLEARFHALSRKCHPDFFQRKSEIEKEISLENTAFLNRAYRTLKDPMKRVKYLICLAGEDEATETAPPSDLFEEIFELEETMEAVKNTLPAERIKHPLLLQKLETARERFQRRQDQAKMGLQALFSKWDSLLHGKQQTAGPFRPYRAFTDQQRSLLKEMKGALSDGAYLERILSSITVVNAG